MMKSNLQELRNRLRSDAATNITAAVNEFGVCVVHNFFKEYPNYPQNIPVFINASGVLYIGDTLASDTPTNMLCKISDELTTFKDAKKS